MAQTDGYKDLLRRLAIIDKTFASDHAGLILGSPGARAPGGTAPGGEAPGGGTLEPRVAALVRVAALTAMGAPEVCLEWITSEALAAGATEKEVAGVLLAVAPLVGLGRVVAAASGVAYGCGYDIDAALEDPSGH